jgi:hypothetical protein
MTDFGTVVARQGRVAEIGVAVVDAFGNMADADPGLTVSIEPANSGAPLPGYPTTDLVHVSTGVYVRAFEATMAVGEYWVVFAGSIDGVPLGGINGEQIQKLVVVPASTPAVPTVAVDADLKIRRGDTPTWTFAATIASAEPLPLDGAGIYFVAKWREDDADVDAVISKAVGNGITVTDATAGIFDVAFAAADTAGLAPRTKLLCAIEIRESGGKVSTPLVGTLTILPDVRRG